MSYSDVCTILVNSYAWGVCPSAAPAEGPVNDALAAGQTDDGIAASLTDFARGYFPPPPGYSEDPWAYKLYWTFGDGSHYTELNTAQALGLAPADPIAPSMPPAYTSEDAVELAKQGWHYSGDAYFLDMTTDAGRTEFARREEFAKTIPPSWQSVEPLLYWYLIVSNRVGSQPVPFGVRQNENAYNLSGFTFQQFLDNEYRQRQHKQPAWLRGGIPNPAG